jgi:transcriptional regulator with XRE-family HTH domain
MIDGLAAKLQDLRKQNKLTQKQVAEMIHASPTVISGYELGTREPSYEKLVKLAYLYHCSTDYLLGKSAESPHLYLDVDGLTDEQIMHLSALIKTMKRTEN